MSWQVQYEDGVPVRMLWVEPGKGSRAMMCRECEGEGTVPNPAVMREGMSVSNGEASGRGKAT